MLQLVKYVLGLMFAVQSIFKSTTWILMQEKKMIVCSNNKKKIVGGLMHEMAE